MGGALRSLVASVTVLAAGCAVDAPPEEVAAAREAVGEPTDGFPNWNERVVHVWTNRARADPAADLASCTVCAERACYSARPPMVWNHDLARAARFHSANLASAGRGLRHDSPCELVSDIGTRYTPGPCNGAVSCACVTGTESCSGSSCTAWNARIASFGTSPSGENIALTGGGPLSAFYLWLHEPDSSSACGFRASNGHRYNILGTSSRIGVGQSGSYWTQDFAGGGSPDGLVSGVHYPQTGSAIEFRANWYDSAAPSEAQLNVDGTCHAMTLERGSGTNGTYLASVSVGSGCARYYFQFEGPSGTVTFPSTGSFGVGCADDWSSTRPAACGCTPSCGGRECGGDGCGGSCGTCSGTRTCSGGSCVCPSGRTECGGVCVDTTRSTAHCGGCGSACEAGASCVGGACVLPGTDAGPPPADAGTAPGTDAGTAPGTDAGTAPGTDAGTAPGTDAGTAPGTDAGTTPAVDAGPPPTGDAATGGDATLRGSVDCACTAPGTPTAGFPWPLLALLPLGRLAKGRTLVSQLRRRKPL